jgi:ParB/RepB/Spo0J family partition protein
MTSGEFRSVPVSSIKVDRDNRQRRELTGIEGLAEDIRRKGGLIHPLLIDRDHNLISGERRLAAVKLLGHDSVPIQYEDETDYNKKRLIELAENIQRIEISWQEQCAAVNEYHDIQVSENKDWTQAATAEETGLSIATVSRYISIAEEIRGGGLR